MAATEVVEILEVDDEVYCVCKQPYDDTRFMIECDVCKDWFHGECVGVEEHQANEIDIYHCPQCQRSHGPLRLKVKFKRKKIKFGRDSLDSDTPVAITKSVKKFIKSLKSRTFRSGDDILLKMRGYQIDRQYIEENGLNKPILVEEPAGLDLIVPPPTFTVSDVELSVGSMRELDVIDVAKQSDAKMLMREFVEYYNNPTKSRILNVISLEFSKTELSKLVTPPRIVDELSWVSKYWPDHTGETRTFMKPEVQKYCLMSVKDSYTDFHVDFGGTSVWYHVIRGKKIFYLIEPTNTNIALYETWASSSTQNAIFFGDQVDACYKTTMHPGQTLFIPTGWIHGVYTPEDSLVFGGNFLHDYSIKLQLEIFEMENRIGTPTRFQFPNFETLCWFTARNLLENMKDSLDDSKLIPESVISGCEALKQRLTSWMSRSDSKQTKRHKEYLPEGMSYTRLLRDLSRVIAQARESHTAKRASDNLDRKALLGLKFKLNKIGDSLLKLKESSPPPASPLSCDIKSEDESDNASEANSEERKLQSCFSDDTYVYPSLLDSDDDSTHRAPKRKKKSSEAWAPKSRVNSGMDNARPRRRSATKQRMQIQSQTKSMNDDHVLSGAAKYRTPKKKSSILPKPESSIKKDDSFKPKVRKGEKTAKQRLGKLLKIHKYNV